MKILSMVVGGVSLACLTSMVNAEVTHVTEHGFVVNHSVITTAPPPQAWQALVDDIDAWWPKDHTWWRGTLSIDAKAGGCFCETTEHNSAEHMRISYVDQFSVLRMSGGLGPLQGMGMFGALDWTFVEADAGTQITLTYKVHGLDNTDFAELAPIVDSVQAMQLQALADFASNVSADKPATDQ
ncbi:SRPBCC family protein [Alteromonas oceanisediminis]|uniref:SRPBCC family protein n=1 Tax=Alteromonas oceanisediminis TaxID=2836180 RepID=UPI001BD94590|nr:SRPBCC domain-containing protein [Alteromonas oceanisediminis]MBT0585341.1 SRPBCC domain-containing protein [Alteromonas oceanisediminis]